MNFFHLSVGHVSRSTGRSTVQNVAYITGEVLYESRRELRADYANNRGKAAWGTMAPLGSGIEEKDLSFWDKLESFEDAYARKRFKNPETLEKYLTHARVGQTYEAALPKELTGEQNIALVREMAFERFVSKGLLATYAINWNEGNPHVHITVSTRTVWNGKISWDKSVSRSLVTPSGLRETRKIFAGFINKHQELAGLSDRVDHRSYADLGIDLIPTRHKGYEAHRLEKEGALSLIGAENAQISQENKQRIGEYPEIILQELTSKQATFTERDVVKLVHHRLKDDVGIISQHVIYSVMKEAVEVGVGFDDTKRYTSKDYKAKEDHILESLEACRGETAAVSISEDRIAELLGGEASWLNAGQKEAVKTLCGDERFSGLIGRAGTGKTTALQYVVQLHKEAGYNVLGMAPSATAAHELRKGAGCPSDTIAHYAYHWKPYFEALEKLEQATKAEEKRLCQETVDAQKAALASKSLPDENTLILVDEIGMVGVGDALAGGEKIAGGWHFLVNVLNKTGAKFIVVGDDHQAKPVEAGDVTRKVFRDFKDTGNLATLTEIQRQKVPWMKEASLHLAELRTSEALGMYETQGHIQNHETNADVYQDMARQYLRKLVAQPDSETLAMAYTNEEVGELNGAIRKILKENCLLEKEDLLTRKRCIEKDTRVKDFEDEGFESSVGKESVGTEGSDAKGQSEEAGGAKDKKGDKTSKQPTGEAKKEKTYAEEGYTVGDKIVFTQNDRGFWTKFDSSDPTFFVRNGMQGRIESIMPCRMVERGTGKLCSTYKISVRVEEEGSGKELLTRVSSARPSTVSFYLREYSHFQHGYAVTIHKTQGATGDGSLVKFSRYMDAYLLYVAMTRHRDNVSAYYSKEDFADFPTLLKTLGKLPQKDLAADYSILEENREFWLMVQEYKALGSELISVRAFAMSGGGPVLSGVEGSNKEEQEKTRVLEAWATVRNLEEERKGLAKIILEDWDIFGEFARQAGISHETIKIAAGFMKRPLSRAEEQAKLVVEQYASVAIETRQAWHTIRRTHPGTQAKTHPQWPTFEALRNQRGVLANQIVQDPVLYRPFLKNTAKAFEEDGGNNNFGYGLHILKTQAEAHQSKMLRHACLQQEMLKDTPDLALSERLQTLLEYVDARDLSASLWKSLKPRLEAFKGTLLSEGFCKEIDEWKEMRMARDQRALKIVDSWEDYSPLIQKVGMKLSFETLMDQKEQAVRDTLLKYYATSQEDSAKLHAAFEIKTLMDEDRAAGKKATVSDAYFYGLQPKDITRHALEYQKLKVFESLKTEPERQLFLLLDEYDDKCREANRIYVVCLNEVKEMNENTSEEAVGKEEAELKLWDAPSWPVYQEACKPRNKLALEIFDRSDHAEIVVLAHAMGLNLKEVELEQVFSRGEKAFRDTHIERYLTSLDQGKKEESAFALVRLINSEKRVSETLVPETSESETSGSAREQNERDGRRDEQSDGKGEAVGSQPLAGGRPSSATAKQAYHAGIDFKELHQVANAYQQARVLQTLTTEADIKTFHALQSYGKATHLANQAYKDCIEEARGKSLDGKSLKPTDTRVAGTRVWETEAYQTYAPLATAQNRIAYTLFEEHDVERMLDLARKMGMSLDVSKFITQVENGMRDFYLETFKETTSDLVKAVSAAEVYGLLEADERQGSKKTFGVLKSKRIPTSDVRDYAHQFNRLSMIESLGTEAEKELFRLYSNYDYHAVVAKGIYRQCVQDTRVPDQGNLGIKTSESEHFPVYKEAVSERNAAANALVQHPDYAKCLDLVERIGLTVNHGLILSHGEDGFREQALVHYKELSQSPGAEPEGTHAEIRKAKLADLLVKMIGDDREEGHKKTLLAIYQAGLNPKDVFAAANEWKEFAVFASLDTQEEKYIFGLVIKYKARSEKANGLYHQCAEDREKLNIKVSDNPLYPDYLAAVSARNESAMALLGCPDWEGCLLLAEQLGIEIDESKVIAQSRDGRREILLDQYTHTDSILVKRLIARELKEMMNEDQKEEKKVTVAGLYRNNILPKDIQEESRQFDRMVAYSQLTNDAEKRVFSLLDQYGDLLIQSNRHYSASFHEAEEQGVKKEKTASYALFQEALKEREKMASLIQYAAKPMVIEWMAEEMGVPLDKLDRDCRNNEIRLKNLGILNQPQNQVMRPSFKAKEEEPEWKPILPVPQDAPPLPDQSNYYKREDMRHPYKDALGNLLGYVVRLIDKKTGKKETPPITWCINKEGEQAWKWKGFGDSNRSLYGLDRLAQYPDKPVLVVEGEKTADVAQKLLPEFVVMTWVGGTGAPHKSNWEPLKGKTVVIWPDNDFDGKGLKAAQKVESIISEHNETIHGDQRDQRTVGQVGIVALPKGVLPNTWDLADDLPDRWTIVTVREMIKETIAQEATQEDKGDLPAVDFAAAHLAKIDPRPSEGRLTSDRGASIDLVAKEFVSLSEKYEKTHWRDPEKEEIRQALDKLASRYWQDERFVTQIKNSGSEVAASNIRLEIHLLETELSRSQHPVGGQTTQEDRHACPNSTGSTSVSLTKVEIAAKEFVSLTERYEKVHWKDPERNAIRASLDKIVSAHWQDKRFVSKIENSGSELAASKITIEIHLIETEFFHSRRELD